MKKPSFTFLAVVFIFTSAFAIAQVQVNVIQNNTSCIIANGIASGSVGGTTSGYTFDWYDAALNPLGVTGPSINNLSAGNYVVIARNASDGTVVGSISFLISDEIMLPQVSIESIANTSCDVVMSNGALITTVQGNLSDYTFAWYEGSDPQGSLISSSTHLTDRIGGNYTLSVTNVITGCVTTLTAQIVNQPAVPVVNVVATNNTNCTTPNGTLTAVTEHSAGQYMINWYDVALNPLGISGVVASNLGAGNYVVTVADVLTNCITTATGVIIDDCDFSSNGFSDVAGRVLTNDKKESSASIGYYPNPASGTLYVSSTGPASLMLVDEKGEVVLRQNVYLTDTPFALDVSGLKSGKYILRANEAGITTNFQIIIKK